MVNSYHVFNKNNKMKSALFGYIEIDAINGCSLTVTG